MNPTPKPWIDAIHAYIPGRATGTDGRALVKLSANENPYGCGDAARAALMQPTQPERYPDPDAAALRDAIAAEHGLDAGRIVCAAGSGDLLGLAAQAYAGPGDEVLYPRYSFSLYEIAARRCGATPVEAGDVEYGADVDTLLAAVTAQTRVVFLANPNNPTGTFLHAAELARLHDGLREDILLVLDHAYGEYVDAAHDDGGLALAQTADNVLMTRTFSKIHGLAGERIGWATGAAPLIATLNRIRGPFNVTTHGQAAATAAIADRAFVDRARAANARDRTAFCSALAALGNHGIRAVPSQANFVLVLFEGALTAQAALAALATGGYAVRHLPSQGLPHALRITIGTGAQMDEIAALIATAAHEAGK